MMTQTDAVSERTEELVAQLVEHFGPHIASTDPDLIKKVSSDWSKMSPILQEKVPAGRYLADAVISPTSEQDVAVILAYAYQERVPVTPRGAGTGNYGQLTPFAGGISLDLRGLSTVAIEGELVNAQAGAKLTDIDKVARAADRDIWMYPSTKGSTIGGFLAGGSAGTGSIQHGNNFDGFVESLTIAAMDGSGELTTLSGPEVTPYLHAYGVTGVITSARVRTDPARHWVAIYASFPSFSALVPVHAALLDLDVLPRLASADEPPLVPTLPAAVELDPSQCSLRIIAEISTVQRIQELICDADGEVVAVLDDYAETDRLSSMSYNHPIFYWQQANGEPTCFHLETGGRLLWDDPDAIRSVFANTRLHLELGRRAPMAMVVADFHSEQQVLDGIRTLESMGLGVHSPHQWYVDRNVALAVDTASRTDPLGLLNPGKLDPQLAAVDTRTVIGVRS